MTEQPGRDQFVYTFENIANVISRFTEVLGLNKFAVYVFDYGAPVGFRLAVKHPERISAIVTQNGNTSLEGVSEAFAPVQAYWKEPTQANRNALRVFLAPQTTLFQYTHGVADPNLVSPDGRNLDDFYLARPGNNEIQLDLLLDYQSNVALYGTIQAYLRRHQPPVLAVWGKNDPFSSRPAPRRSGGTCPRPTSASSIAAISPWRPMHAKSVWRCATSSPSISADAVPAPSPGIFCSAAWAITIAHQTQGDRQ